MNIINGKVSIASVNGAGGSGGVLRLQLGIRGQSTFRKFSGSKEHLDWLKRNLNADEIITVHEYKH